MAVYYINTELHITRKFIRMVIMTNQSTKQGFVILIAVLVSTLVISIGAFIASIALKELALSSSGRESQIAFYAADSALECALYQDLRVESFAASGTAPGPANVYCDGKVTPISEQNGDAVSSQTFFELSFRLPDELDDLNSPYARVRVTKSNIGTINDKTVIEAQGYNTKNASSTHRVERALQVIY